MLYTSIPTSFSPVRFHLTTSNSTKFYAKIVGLPSSSISVSKSYLRTFSRTILTSAVLIASLGLHPSLSHSHSPSLTPSHQSEQEPEDDSDLLKLLVESNPRDFDGLKMAFYAEIRKGRSKEALKYVERLIDADPDEVEWRLLQALSYELMGELEKAKNLFQRVLEKKPLFIRGLHGLALVMHKLNEGPAVFEMLNEALELAHRDQRVTEERNIQILIAQMHVVKGDLEGGLKHFQKLVDSNPRDFRPFLCQGIIYNLLDKKEEANEQFKIYQSLVPDEFPQRDFLDNVILESRDGFFQVLSSPIEIDRKQS
ncbi:Tetratricopeptide repeat (TPR)-like superfamily protein [Zostera marina]|uniref:Tetratricopeptide repeat (TPR)-like superfamily protein n=1 Tax=Zostera marina TaxID=29655 RepID=A0A0K9NHQ8_ZOSMR|nr:Tetratricopeptide repeat (TPR)-like superfamily protein [Zostera marina]